MEQQLDMLADIHDEINLEAVSTGIRFANYILDAIGFYLVVIMVGIAFAFLAPQVAETPLTYIISYGMYITYYTLLEGATGGRTLGKMITGTRAVKDDGTIITWKDAFLRSLCRIVPFEPFSALGGYPWHDKWTNTKVVKNKKKLE